MGKRYENRKRQVRVSEAEADDPKASTTVSGVAEPGPTVDQMVPEDVHHEAVSEGLDDVKPQMNTDEKYNYVPPIDANSREPELSGLDVFLEDESEIVLDEDSEYGKLPHPDVFNAYPPEIQRKIMEWVDRDVKARRDDESRRQDELMRAEVESNRRKQMFPTIITVLALVCAAVTGVVTQNPLFPLVFLLSHCVR